MKFIDFFSGIGGFRLGMEMAGHECVGHCEIDKYADKSYQSMHNVKENEFYANDITRIEPADLPDAECYCGGFPCQAFSIAGKRGGFDDTRGTLFFEVMRLAKVRKPQYLFLENVKGLLSHDGGRTFGTIISTLGELGYDAEWQVLNSKNFGVPQNRERVFIIGTRQDYKQDSIFPLERIEINGNEIEKMYLLSEGISQHIGTLPGILQQSKAKEIPRREMQDLLKQIQQGIQEGTSREIQEAGQDIQPNSEGNIQEIETDFKGTSCNNIPRGFYGMVSIPTEEMLLLWHRGTTASCDNRQYQQKVKEIIYRQNRFIEKIRKGEFSTLLFAVQSYQGRLFYSIGDGRDWTKIYSKEVGKWSKTLSCILEDEVGEEFFLSTEVANSQLGVVVKDDQQYIDNIATDYDFLKGKMQKMINENGELPEMFNPYNEQEVKEVAPTQTTSSNSSSSSATVCIKQPGFRIRKLTPKECFRLQGFPDEYFERAKEVNSNSQLYKQAGNSVTVNVIYEIARRLE